MKNSFLFQLFIVLIVCSSQLLGQTYPPSQQLVNNSMPNVAKPAYLNPITDPTFGTTVIRVTDQAVFNTHNNGMGVSHHYAKNQPWNSDGTLIKMHGWPSAILDAQTYQVVSLAYPLGGPHTWSHTKPNIIYGTNNTTGSKRNCISQVDVTTNVKSDIQCFSQYENISYGYWEGNMSNDDRYMALQCEKPNGDYEIAVYDFVTDAIVATLPASVYPNNVTMSQSGNYFIVQWNVQGTGVNQGIWAYERTNVNNRQFLSDKKGNHYDAGYDTQGNEVIVGTLGSGRNVRMVRLDNGASTDLLSAAKMSWPLHISCRNTNRPGWAYISDFAASYAEPNKPYYRKMFAVKLDPGVNGNAPVQVFAHTHHSTNADYTREVFGVPNRDGSIAMFRSDWMGNSSSEVNSYVAYMPGGSSCNLSCSATQISAPTCSANNGSATANPQGGTTPYTYSWNNGQTTKTIVGLGAGTYTVNITDANNCSTSCTVTVTGPNIPSCTVAETTAPSCGENNGIATATVQGGTPPYTYLWDDPQAQTTALAINLPDGTYSVVVTDANNCTTQGSITLTDPTNLSCSIVETTIPSGGNNGVATVTVNGGTTTTGDPRTDLLASPHRIGYGAAATGGTNYVYVTNFNQLKNALETSGNYVLLDPSVSNQGIGFSGRITPASNTTLDGSLAPGSWLYPNYNAGYPANTSMINFFSTSNCIVYSVEFRGDQVVSGNSGNVGVFNVRGATNWFDHLTITGFTGHPFMFAQGGNHSSLSNLKIVNTVNGVWLFYPFDTPRYISLFNSEISADQNTPYNEGASHFHMWNNYIHDVLFGSSLAGLAENNAAGQNGPVRTYSQNNVFTNCSPEAERGLLMGENWGGPVQLPGFIYSTGAIYNTANSTRGNVVNTTAPWTIPYNYTLLPASQVEAYVAVNAGKIPVTGSANYTYQWNDPAGQTTAVANGLAPGTYTVTVTDGAGCTTVCSITMTGAPITCNVNLWLEGAFNTTDMDNTLQQLSLLPMGQPYNTPPWNYNGTEGGGWLPSDYPPGSIDWVLLTLRTTDQPGSVAGKGAGLLMEDGTIQNATVELTSAPASAYYIVVEHRNHLPAMTPTAIPLINNSLTYDFRQANSYAQGGFGQKTINNTWMLYAGNIDQSSPVGYEITGADLILWQAVNGNFGVYSPEDINMDGDVNGQDRVLHNNNNGISSAVKK